MLMRILRLQRISGVVGMSILILLSAGCLTATPTPKLNEYALPKRPALALGKCGDYICMTPNDEQKLRLYTIEQEQVLKKYNCQVRLWNGKECTDNE